MRLQAVLALAALAGLAAAKRWGNMSQRQIQDFRNSLRQTNVERTHGALQRLRQALRSSLSQDEAAEAAQRTAQLKAHPPSIRLRQTGDTLFEVNQNAGVLEDLYQGDVALHDSQVDQLLGEFTDDSSTRTKRGAAYRSSSYPANLWSTVYYQFDSKLPAHTKTVAQHAIKFWTENTCIDFVLNATAPNRIRIFAGSGCYSYVGMIGGVQDLSLGPGCDSVGTALHEFGHALGFFHEQSRVDRNKAIVVNLQNVLSGWEDQFDRVVAAYNFNYRMPYDYGSVMHYAATVVTKNGRPTMVARLPAYQDTMGGETVSFYDLAMMNQFYKCNANCPKAKSAVCLNGGYPHPRNCKTCICPSGWGGATCTAKATGCGSVLTATAAAKTLTFTVGVGTATVKDVFRTCAYQIRVSSTILDEVLQAPAGQKVEIQITAMKSQQCFGGCPYTGLELKGMGDQRYTGVRYCCADDVSSVLVSEGNVVPVLGYNRGIASVPASTESTVKVGQVPDTGSTFA